MNALKWLWGYVKKYRLSILFTLLLTAVFIVCAFVIPVVLGRIVDDVIYGGNTGLLFFYSILLLASVGVKELVIYARQITVENFTQNVIRAIRNKLYGKLQELDCSYFDKTRKGDIMSRLTMDTDAIRVLLSSTLPGLIDQVFFIVIGVGIMYEASPLLTILLISTSPFIAFFAYFLAKYIKHDFIAMRESNSKLNTVVAENISGNRVVKAYAKEEYEIEKFEKCNEDYKDSFMAHIKTWIKYAPTMLFFVNLTYFIFIVVGGKLVIDKAITIGQFTIFNGCLWCITSPMSSVGNIINQFQQFNASSLKIRQLEDEQSKIENRNVKKRDTGISGKIQFKNVTFSYDGDRVLKNVNFTVNPGETLAIIGPTGSGKSTVINLINRFYDPTHGTVYIDDVNIKNIDLKTLRKNVASAMQDVFLFSDTVKNNIAYGAPNATYEDVERVAKAANAHDFIEKMSDGYDTMVGERGVGLSGGQRQRISLARALLKNPSILILDDTTSALDMETEYNIQENLKETLKTKIIIAHRISSVKNADLILVLNHGNLIEWGTHDELIALGGYYKGVFDHQFGDFNSAPSYHISHPAKIGVGNKGGEANGN
ncbi:MAG: ABC transporter ATP-binding protein [Ruminococcaceae bacterium]|nr:ABC transporter ATP-binding protein [Oscillospiraceae bacterium]